MRKTRVRLQDLGPYILTREYQEAKVPILSEVRFAVELVLLHAAPVYYGLGTPHGDGSAVVLIPGFLCPDHYLLPLHRWLGRMGYRAFFSGMRINAECPNLLIKRCLNETIEKALAQTGRRIHLIGHSLGGIIAPFDRGSAATGQCFRHYAGRAVPRYIGTFQHPARSQDSSPPHPEETRRRGPCRLLYWALHLRFCGFPAALCAPVGGRNCGLHARRRSG